MGRRARPLVALSAAFVLAGPVESCKHVFGADPPDAAPPPQAFTGRIAEPVYGGPPPPPPPPPVAPDAGSPSDAAPSPRDAASSPRDAAPSPRR